MAARLPRTITALVLAGALLVAGAPFAPSATAFQPSITIEGGGWGHGVGMSQYGALGQAQASRTYGTILGHYYQGTNLANGYSNNDVRVLLDTLSGATHQIDVKGPAILQRPGPDVPLVAGDRVRVHSNGTRIWISINGTQENSDGWLIGSGRRPAVHLNGTRAVLSRVGGATIGEYRFGRIEVSAGISGCGGHQCAVVRNMSMEQYLRGLAEMPSSWPAHALRAQAVAGRSFAATRVGTDPARLFDMHRSVLDQVYAGTAKEDGAFGDQWVAAVSATSGEILRRNDNNAIVRAFYHSTSGGHTENSEYVWSENLPYARAVADPWDAGSPRHSWSRSYTLAEIGAWFGVSNVRDVRVSGNVGTSGRIDKATVSIIGSTTKTVTGNQFRQTVNQQVPDSRALWSTKFRILGAGGFPDVPPNAYYAPGVAWLASEGITTGYGTTGRYEPDIAVTRGQMAAFLWRVMGSPHSGAPHGFPDVPPGAFYEGAVRWLTANGITDGYGTTGRFEPDLVVSRAQMATFLHRLARLKAPTTSHAFPDVVSGSYYEQAVSWAVQHGITDGYGTTGRFEPDLVVSRAQMAAFLFRLASRASAWSGPLPPTAP